ncbi:XdhC family protein [Aridibaculum aurantiacum]|uniref:XdhC family protein n=1 Tax=Aridibaculum aurantiacum TaxID=2810307 RepID=UPI001A96FA43|nr:XdhC/CoxI family protein [Aridibaculum aurantiacum]
MEVWQYIHDKLQVSVKVLLLWVLESEGSSPGRRGFKMAVASDGSFEGTIGGGIMEHKLVEKAKAMLTEDATRISLMQQYHDKQHAKDQSGMICSGSQRIAFVPLNPSSLVQVAAIVKAICNHEKKMVQLTREGLTITSTVDATCGFQQLQNEEWIYTEKADQRPVIHIIGAGHVGLALSELMHFLGFYVKMYDNREGLNTFTNNRFAHEKHVVDYHRIVEVLPSNKEEFVVIMTFGYRDDKIVFRQLLDKEYYYLGLMGSDAKIKTLLQELEAEGFDPAKWKHCHAPIGINIFSKTTKEIAVSIAAEIIKEKNKNLSSGRAYSLEQE